MRLPPLNALKAFEAAARHGSYVAAARELGVTPAAISQQVRHLETYYAHKLFLRHNNRVVLTDAGQGIFAGVTPALEAISDLGQKVIAGRSRSRLVVSAIPSLAECWLWPRLSAFLVANPDQKIELRIEADPVDFAHDNIDLRLCYGRALYPSHQSAALFQDYVVPLCSPDFFDQSLGGKIDWVSVADEKFIHTVWGPSFISNPNWSDWFEAYEPAREIDNTMGHKVGMSKLAIDLAIAGHGIALGQFNLAHADIAAGRLLALSEKSLPIAQNYYGVYPEAKSKKESLLNLVDWLKNAVAYSANSKAASVSASQTESANVRNA